jgi:DNA-binding response OmpR family regulator
VEIDGEELALTPLEFKLMTAFARHPRQVLSRDQLLDAVYGEDQSGVLDRTIDVHVRRLRDKLGDDADEPRYVSTVRGVGYRTAPRPGSAS